MFPLGPREPRLPSGSNPGAPGFLWPASVVRHAEVRFLELRFEESKARNGGDCGHTCQLQTRAQR